MSRRISSFHVRAGPASIPRRKNARRFPFAIMDDELLATGPLLSPPPSIMLNQTAAPAAAATNSSRISVPRSPHPVTSSSRPRDPSIGIAFAQPTAPQLAFPHPARPFSTTILQSGRARKISASRVSASQTLAEIMGVSPDKRDEDEDDDGPLGETQSLYDALEDDFDIAAARDAQEEDGYENAASTLEDPQADDQEAENPEDLEAEAPEDPIERVSTPEGEVIVLWKKKPIVYTDESEPYVPPAHQLSASVQEAKILGETEHFHYDFYVNAAKQPPVVHYVTDVDEMERVVKMFEGDKVLGFDMEWHPGKLLRPPQNDRDIRLNCSVIQIANSNRIAIFHLAKFPTSTKAFLSPTLKKIIEDPEVLKTGVSVRFDMQRLATLINISPAGSTELGECHSLLFAAQKQTLETGHRLPASLASLCEHHLGFPLNKGDVRTSDWSAALTERQQQYAADDAYASFRIFDEMEKVRRSLDPRPALPPYYSCSHIEVIEAFHKKKAKQSAGADTPKKKTVIRIPKNLNPSLATAYEWVQEYAKTIPDGVLTASVADLRCYSLWHHQGLDLNEIAFVCRSPPLTEPYVATKVLEAIRLEDLPYNPKRLGYVIRSTPKQGRGRYFTLRTEMIEKLNAPMDPELNGALDNEISNIMQGDLEQYQSPDDDLGKLSEMLAREAVLRGESFGTPAEYDVESEMISEGLALMMGRARNRDRREEAGARRGEKPKIRRCITNDSTPEGNEPRIRNIPAHGKGEFDGKRRSVVGTPKVRTVGSRAKAPLQAYRRITPSSDGNDAQATSRSGGNGDDDGPLVRQSSLARIRPENAQTQSVDSPAGMGGSATPPEPPAYLDHSAWLLENVQEITVSDQQQQQLSPTGKKKSRRPKIEKDRTKETGQSVELPLRLEPRVGKAKGPTRGATTREGRLRGFSLDSTPLGQQGGKAVSDSEAPDSKIVFRVSGELGEAFDGLTSETLDLFKETKEVDEGDIQQPEYLMSTRKVFVPQRRKAQKPSA